MSRSTALLKQLLPALTLDLRDELQKEAVLRTRQSCVIADDICSGALAQLQDAAVLLKRMHNTAFARAQFPPEVWCLVWSFLPRDADIITVTHVCDSWRTAAIGYPAFWTRVRFWTTAHGDGGTCDRKMCDCPTNIQTHNLDQVATWLERSKSAQISISLLIHPVYSDHQLALRLATVVLPHARRIAKLTCYLGDLDFIVYFMHRARNFESVHVINMHGMIIPRYCGGWPLTNLCLDTVVLPRLLEFHSRTVVEWDIVYPSDRALPFSALQRLSCKFSDPQYLFDALRSCPRLVSLNAEFYDPATIATAPALNYAELVPQLDTIVLDCMTQYWSTLLEPVILRPALKNVTLRHTMCDTDTLFSPLTPLSGALHLSVLVDGHSISVSATDTDAHSRIVNFGASVSSLTISWHLRAALLDNSLVAPRLARIRLVVTQDDNPFEESPTVEGPKPGLPALSVLEIASTGRRCSISDASVREFTAVLSDSPLSLELDGVELR
ncbi:hypothetical protein AURDEDRAFT_173793 [Auricularia subglabra TFB-10046 SS5]|nr:hypothetical protein AURDEDRAFT_173793 [Auricularia subglabra TFB-10046 SS5]